MPRNHAVLRCCLSGLVAVMMCLFGSDHEPRIVSEAAFGTGTLLRRVVTDHQPCLAILLAVLPSVKGCGHGRTK